MQTASTNICERLCNKLIRKISLLLNIPRSTDSGIIRKWKQLGTTPTQPQSGRPCKMTVWGQRMLKCTVCRSLQLSAESIAKDIKTACGLQINSGYRASWNGFPWPSSCIQALHHQVLYNASMQWRKAHHHWIL
ncbi:unnamed protein product, partial [Staurois parvus]